jgi:hypothetical protein
VQSLQHRVVRGQPDPYVDYYTPQAPITAEPIHYDVERRIGEWV